MFKPSQIVSASQMKRDFYKYSCWIRNNPQAILIHNKNGRPLVLVDAEIFEDLMDFKYEVLRNPPVQQTGDGES